MDEFGLIDRYFKPLGATRADVRVGIGDDAAVIETPADLLAVAVDTLVADVHFPADLPPEHVGYRAVAVNLSDLAAMGATPCHATLALTLPEADPAWLEGFARGMGEALAPARVALVGGDTTRGPLTVTVQLTGIFEGAPLRRDGGAPGDLIAVSGTLGDAAAGLDVIRAGRPSGNAQATLARRFERPQPRLELARIVRPFARAAIDVSDGLLADVGHLAACSSCAAEIGLERLPLSAELETVCGRQRGLAYAASGGDDYELVFALDSGSAAAALEAAAALGIRLTEIGRLREGAGVRLLGPGHEELTNAPDGYRHFS